MQATTAPTEELPGAEPRRARWPGITLGVLGALLVVLILFIISFLWFSVRRAHPDVDGEVSLLGLDGRVEMVRDEMGIPHIYATTTHDLFFAQGYAHAQDRFWQMDFWRHIGSGRLAEMFGADQVETDAFLRTLGWETLAEQQYAEASGQGRMVLEAYADGVNAYLRPRSPAELGFEYTILELVNHGYEPEPWTPVHTLTWGKVMAWDLSPNMGQELDRAFLLRVLSPERVEQLYPPYPGDRHPYIVPFADAGGESVSLQGDIAATLALNRVAERLDAVDGILASASQPGIGSNSWVLAGDRSPTGMPFLANDTHLAIQMPAIWYQVGLHCAEVTDACPFDVAGFSLAGVPGVVIGHNRDIAWGFTNLGPDVQDLYIERINPANPNQYQVNGRWIDMDVRREVLEVAGGDPVEVTVRTTRHGPIISDTFEPMEDFATDAGIDLPDPFAVALRWTALDASAGLIEPFLGLNTAANWEDFRAALRAFDVPAQNVIYADIEGNIGYQATGRIPVRAAGDGRLPVPGWNDDHEWVAFIPPDDLPRIFNPPQGYIVTANNAVIGDGYPFLLTTDWNYGYRARRIVDLITSNPILGLEEQSWMQFDSHNGNAEQLRPFVLAVATEGWSEKARRARRTLTDWNLRNEAQSSGAAIFAAFWSRLLEATFHDDLPEDQWPGGGSRWFEVVRTLVLHPDDLFWDDRTTVEIEGRDEILERAFLAAVDDLADTQGGDPAGWRWGEMHHATFESATLGQTGIALIDDRFNRGPFPASGGDDLPNATGWTATEGFFVDWVPSQRMLVDMANLDRSLAIHTTGQSGHTDHPHYDDMIPLWLNGEYYSMLWSRDKVEARAEATLTMTPRG